MFDQWDYDYTEAMMFDQWDYDYCERHDTSIIT